MANRELELHTPCLEQHSIFMKYAEINLALSQDVLQIIELFRNNYNTNLEEGANLLIDALNRIKIFFLDYTLSLSV